MNEFREDLGVVYSEMHYQEMTTLRTSKERVIEFPNPSAVTGFTGCRLERTLDFGHILINGIAMGSVSEVHHRIIFFPTAAREAIAKHG